MRLVPPWRGREAWALLSLGAEGETWGYPYPKDRGKRGLSFFIELERGHGLVPLLELKRTRGLRHVLESRRRGVKLPLQSR